ncbi:MAG TPA: SPOR domain-containing protein [Burkholderiales bacterium]|nr:SPOR domain-containing protein [Burkholderiales bacterium]
MRALFLLMVLANLVFFAFAQVAREPGALSQISQLEVSPEKIEVVKASSKASADGPPSSGTPTPDKRGSGKTIAPSACIEWGIFAGPDVARAESALGRLDLPQDRVERTVTDAGGYWVYIPALKSKSETDRKIGELKALGVSDFFIVQDAGQWRNSISLGIFRTDEAAQSFLNKLRDRGVRSAVAERRENFLKQIAFLVREPDESTVARLAALQREFPGSELKATQCTSTVATKG